MTYQKRVLLDEGKVGWVDYVDHMGSDLTIVNAARVSFAKHKQEMDDSDINLIAYLVKHKHTSPFEHNVVTFRVKVPIFIRTQHFRHRTWSFNEISRRYTSENLIFYNPGRFRTQHKNNRQASNPNEFVSNETEHHGLLASCSDVIAKHHEDSLALYHKLLEAGVCREQARGVLPQNLFTEYYATANLSNLFKFIELRIQEGAQFEIQLLARAFLEILNDLFPVTMKAY